jgi:hypothetical protein
MGRLVRRRDLLPGGLFADAGSGADESPVFPDDLGCGRGGLPMVTNAELLSSRSPQYPAGSAPGKKTPSIVTPSE